MKRITANVTLLMVVALLFTAASQAQHPTLNLKVDVPFEFSVGKKTLPASEYLVTQVGPHTLALRDSNNGLVTVFMTSPMLLLARKVTPKLRFEVADGRPVLSEVWSEGTTGYRLSVRKRVPALAQNRPADTEIQAVQSSSAGK